jgi:predicted branched-subunit amino acid permease
MAEDKAPAFSLLSMPSGAVIEKFAVWVLALFLPLTFKSLLVMGCKNKLKILTTVRSAQTVFMCFVFV